MKISSNHPDVVILHSNNTKTDNAETHISSDDSEREVIPDEDEDLNISDCSDTVIDYTETGVNSISPDSTLSVHSGSEKVRMLQYNESKVVLKIHNINLNANCHQLYFYLQFIREALVSRKSLIHNFENNHRTDTTISTFKFINNLYCFFIVFTCD